jgi:uncharacterized protein (TIGR00297 family)
MSISGEILAAVVGLLVNTGAAVAAGRRGSLTPSGVVAAALVGTAIFAAGGLGFWLMLMLFFLSSTGLSRAGKARKRDLERLHEKGSRRDAMQVIANGGIAAVAIVAARFTGTWWLAVAAADGLAAANADTWASELGVLSRQPPRSIITWKRLEPGVSGGVSTMGTLAGVAGSLVIALWYLVVSRWIGAWPAGDPGAAGPLFRASSVLVPGLIVLVAGIAGTTIDSILGAAIQAQYLAADGSRTEKRAQDHDLVRGLRFVTNDVVNLASTAGAAVIAGVLARTLGV